MAVGALLHSTGISPPASAVAWNERDWAESYLTEDEVASPTKVVKVTCGRVLCGLRIRLWVVKEVQFPRRDTFGFSKNPKIRPPGTPQPNPGRVVVIG